MPGALEEERKRDSAGLERKDLVEFANVRRAWACLLFANTARERRDAIGRALRTRHDMVWSTAATAAAELDAMVTWVVV